MTTQLVLNRDKTGAVTFGLQETDVKNGVLLAQNVAQTLITLPGDADNYEVFFSYTPGANVFVNTKGTAAVFSGTAGTVNSELNPNVRSYPKNTVISVITPDVAGVYVQALAYSK